MNVKLLTLAACIGLSACISQPASDPAKTSKEIAGVLARWQKAFEAKDVNGAMAMYAPGDALTAYDVTPPLEFKGAAAYRQDYVNFFAGFDGPIHVELRDAHIEPGTNLAFAYGLERISGKTTDGANVDVWLRYTEDFKRINDQWRVVHEHISVPVDIATGKARLDLKP